MEMEKIHNNTDTNKKHNMHILLHDVREADKSYIKHTCLARAAGALAAAVDGGHNPTLPDAGLLARVSRAWMRALRPA